MVEMDRRMSDQEITCPMLDWDSGMASDGISVSEHVITNISPAVTPPDTGCRVQEINSCLASRPLMVRNSHGQLYMYQVNLTFSLQTVIPDNTTVLEKTLTASPVDAGWSQVTGLSVRVVTCLKHKQQLCLRVFFNNTLLTDHPLIQNTVGQSYDLQLGFLLDGSNNKIQVLNATDNTVYTTVTDVALDRPMWVKMYAGRPSTLESRVELISGHNITGSFTDYNR
ncbi:uncharacterized protein LOC125380067 [Haliotis rufescens]|uniref:uncharacterized protein LOC125380067 n=1 Tax=Haliotis rufescens TaxID=6454 RepID=UPI00201EEFD4|nr:uncharacterized protein LOC125380067 [Haliotis rufescens]